MNTPRYFIRNDDVGARTPALERFVDTFLGHELPVSYQIIPEKLTPDCARWLADLRAAHPHLISFGQHGLRHEMRVRGKQVWREFGPERSYAEQYADIALGKAMLEAALGPIHLFTPPQHKYDRNTLRALETLGFSHFSAASYAAIPYRMAYAAGRALGWSSIRQHGLSRHGGWREDVRLFELSISVAIDNGGRLCVSPHALEKYAARAAHHTAKIGFMLHHAVYAERADELRDISNSLSQLGKINIFKIEDLCADPPPTIFESHR